MRIDRRRDKTDPNAPASALVSMLFMMLLIDAGGVRIGAQEIQSKAFAH